jgi:hypothetical protein
MKLTGVFTPTKWDEKTYEVVEDRMKATKASVESAFSGDIEGKANIEYLMFYRSVDATDAHKSVASYVGLITIVGRLKGKGGSFAMIDNGRYENGAANSTLAIVAGSGTGELSQIAGTGSYRADQSGCTWELDVSL